MVTSHKYPAYLEAVPHSPNCMQDFQSCNCEHNGTPLEYFWALHPDDIELKSPGKWLIFPEAEDCDDAWNRIQGRTQVGKLGFAAKCSFKSREYPAILVSNHRLGAT